MNIDLSYAVKQKVRETEFSGLRVGSDASFSFMKENDNSSVPKIAIEIPYFFDSAYPEILKQIWNVENACEAIKVANGSLCDAISIKFNFCDVPDEKDVDDIKLFFDNISRFNKKPLILRGANNNLIDKVLLSLISELAPSNSVIAFADEQTYEMIIPAVLKKDHVLVLRTPIDINLAKELNILSIDKGLSADRILVDPDMGGLGYGLDYGYSIIERIKMAGFDGDNMLNMPIIAFIGEETYRAKEAKFDKFSESYGDLQKRSQMWELSAASALISAGANIVVLWNPNNVCVLKELV